MLIKAGFCVQEGLKAPLFVDFRENPHWILNGGSGAGKSVLLQYLLNSLLNDSVEIFFCDPKGSGDFQGVTQNYAQYDDCVEMIEKVYEKYLEIKMQKTGKRIILICDEYPALILRLEGIDKKRAAAVKNKISELLMQGRALPGGGSVAVWLVCQRADAEYFPRGARLNMMVVIAMGQLDAQTKTMLFPGEELPSYEAITGTGLIKINGQPIRVLRVPEINLKKLKGLLREKARIRSSGYATSDPEGGT